MSQVNNRSIVLKEYEYLAFEGGGGKGIVYLGVIQALEKYLNHTRLISTDDVTRRIIYASNMDYN